MRSAYEVPSFSLTTEPLAQVDADLVAVPFFEGGAETVPTRLGPLAARDVAAAIERGAAKADIGAVYVTGISDGGWRATRLAVIGAGRAATVESVRRVAAVAALQARQQRLPRLALDLASAGETTPALAAAASDGVVFGCFDHGHLKSRDGLFWLASATLVTAGAGAIAGAVEEGRVLGEAVNVARLLANEPANLLTPQLMAERAGTLLSDTALSVHVLDHEAIAGLGMGLLMGVGQGSDNPPRLVVCEYRPERMDESAPVLGLIGKGITFDTGGISIKPAEGLGRMKDDMAGAAAVVGAMRAIARLGAPCRIIALMPLAENMLSGRATRPGDVLRGASGLTVEITNTDAEGRLILGDAVWYARQLGATHLVDVATLTGACVVALGMQITGLFARPAEWGASVAASAASAGEQVWQMPLHEEYRDLLKSEVADMINSPGRAAGAITAALFIEEFSRGGPWAHLDIAGTAWSDEAKAWAPKGASGAMVRTLVDLARRGPAGWPS